MLARMASICAFLAALPLLAQVAVGIYPEPMEATAAFGVTKWAVWDVDLTNKGTASATVNPADVYALAPKVRWLRGKRAELALQRSQSRSFWAKVLLVATYGDDGAMLITGSGRVSASMEIISGLAIAVPVLHRLSERAKGQVPDTAPFLTDLLRGPVKLMPGESQSFVLIAGKMKAPEAIQGLIGLPPDTSFPPERK